MVGFAGENWLLLVVFVQVSGQVPGKRCHSHMVKYIDMDVDTDKYQTICYGELPAMAIGGLTEQWSLHLILSLKPTKKAVGKERQTERGTAEEQGGSHSMSRSPGGRSQSPASSFCLSDLGDMVAHRGRALHEAKNTHEAQGQTLA